MYQQFLQIVAGLNKGTKFEITKDWLVANRINASPGNAKSIGLRFAKSFAQYNCRQLSKGTDNHLLYEKL